MNSKELFRTVCAGRPVPRSPFVPYVASAAARLMQTSVKQLYSDPTRMANTLQSCQRLFKYDAVAVLFDHTLEAEAGGCVLEWKDDGPPVVTSPAIADATQAVSFEFGEVQTKGRWPAVFEATKRLIVTCGRDVPVFGVVNGPVDVAGLLTGGAVRSEMTSVVDKAGAACIKLVRTFCDLRVDAIVLADNGLHTGLTYFEPQISATLKTIRNVTRHYDVRLFLHSETIEPGTFQQCLTLPADGFFLGSETDVSALSEACSKLRLVCGASLSPRLLLGPSEDVEQALREIVRPDTANRLLITTQGEVPYLTPAMNLHKVLSCVSHGDS